MQSTGNDIVSLNAINVTRTKQPNFYSKILTPTETALHQEPRFATIPFEIFVWLLWSIKESAFKYLQRADADIIFTPVKLEVSEIYVPEGFGIGKFSVRGLAGNSFDLLQTITSVINFEDKIFYSTSLIYNELIFTVVDGDKYFNNTYWGIKEIDDCDAEIQSIEVRTFLIDNFPAKNIVVTKNDKGIPSILLSDGANVPASLSHHENWVAYSFKLTTEHTE